MAEKTYDDVLKDFERRYPQLNPDSNQFDRGVTDSVSARMNRYISAGHGKAESLQLAVTDAAMLQILHEK